MTESWLFRASGRNVSAKRKLSLWSSRPQAPYGRRCTTQCRWDLRQLLTTLVFFSPTGGYRFIRQLPQRGILPPSIARPYHRSYHQHAFESKRWHSLLSLQMLFLRVGCWATVASVSFSGWLVQDKYCIVPVVLKCTQWCFKGCTSCFNYLQNEISTQKYSNNRKTSNYRVHDYSQWVLYE